MVRPVAPPPNGSPPEVSHLSRVLLALVGSMALLSGIGFAVRGAPSTTLPSGDVAVDLRVRSEDLSVTTRLVPMVDALLPSQDWGGSRTWRMPGYDRPRAVALLAGLRGADETLRCDASGCVVQPALDAVAALSPADRGRIYGTLLHFDHNPQAENTFYRPPDLGPFSAVPDVPSEVRPLLDALTWSHQGVPAFSDLAVVCDRLGSRAACTPFARAMLSRPTAEVSLRIAERGVIDRVVASFPEGDRVAVRAQLEAARASHATQFPLEALLPSWARSRLGTFPAVGEDWTNCFWTSLRFLGVAGNTMVANPTEMEAHLRRDFVRVTTPPQFGDLLLVRDHAQAATHSATWLLGGYLFEKNGYGRLQAWRIVPMTQVLADYPEASSTEVWRLRER